MKVQSNVRAGFFFKLFSRCTGYAAPKSYAAPKPSYQPSYGYSRCRGY